MKKVDFKQTISGLEFIISQEKKLLEKARNETNEIQEWEKDLSAIEATLRLVKEYDDRKIEIEDILKNE